MKKILLGTIRLYWRAVPMPVRSAMSKTGTSVEAFEKISAGAGLWTFIVLALPLRKIGSRLGVYEGQGVW